MKKGFILILIIVFLMSTVTAFAADAQVTRNKSDEDTLSFTQTELMQNLSNIKDPTESATMTCEAFLRMFRGYVRDADYDLSLLIASSALKKDSIQYRLSEAEYYKQLDATLDWKITSDEQKLSVLSEKIGSDTATIEVLEEYAYEQTNGFDTTCYRNRVYTFTLQKEAGKWMIADVVTNDPWESQKDFSYEKINVKEAVAFATAEQDSEKVSAVDASKSRTEAIGKESPLMSTAATGETLYKWEYNPSVAVSYAVKYWNSNNGTVFGAASSADCQNFASQCVWAGTRGSYSNATAADGKDYPAVTKGKVTAENSDNWKIPRVWAHGESDSNGYACWDVVNHFARMVKYSKTSTIGIFGNVRYGELDYADLGDVIFVDWGGATATESNIDHALVVTKTSSTAVGSRGMSDLYISAHNNNQGAYEPLGTYLGSLYTEKSFATAIIGGGYYPERK